jgi:hypothetical protein
MSPNKQKIKGSSFERQIAEYLNEKLLDGHFKRIPGSGSIGTAVGESILTGDINGEIKGFPKTLKAECKFGYSNKAGKDAKSLTLQKEWLDKIKQEAETNYRMPIFFGKFDNVHTGVKAFVAFDLETFIMLANHITKLKEELDMFYEEKD